MVFVHVDTGTIRLPRGQYVVPKGVQRCGEPWSPKNVNLKDAKQ